MSCGLLLLSIVCNVILENVLEGEVLGVCRLL